MYQLYSLKRRIGYGCIVLLNLDFDLLKKKKLLIENMLEKCMYIYVCIYVCDEIQYVCDNFHKKPVKR